MVEALEQLRHRGLRLGVVTNKPTGPTLEILKAFALARFFGAVVCGDTLRKRKPDPAPLLFAAARLEIAPAETIMVGDNYHDVAAARAAAMRVMIVTWGYLRGCSEKFGGDCILQSFADVPQALRHEQRVWTCCCLGALDAAGAGSDVGKRMGSP